MMKTLDFVMLVFVLIIVSVLGVVSSNQSAPSPMAGVEIDVAMRFVLNRDSQDKAVKLQLELPPEGIPDMGMFVESGRLNGVVPIESAKIVGHKVNITFDRGAVSTLVANHDPKKMTVFTLEAMSERYVYHGVTTDKWEVMIAK